MDYLDRLIRRALAVPRTQAGVFDPFERVAPWIAEPTAVDAPASANPVDVRSTPAAAIADRVRPVVPLATAPVAAPALTSLQASAQVPDSVDAIPTASTPATDLVQPAARGIDPPSGAPLSRQARADVFMQALGMPQAAREAGPLAVPPTSVTEGPARPPDGPPAPAARAAPDEPVLLRPQTPRATPATEVAAAPRRPAPAANAARAQPQPATRPARPPETQRIVQTTVVVAPPSRRLDELAHSSAISRFGIGQG